MIETSIVIPVYKNSRNIPSLFERLTELANELGGSLEVVFVVDGSPDDSYDVLRELLPASGFESQLIRHSRNFGSFPAIRTGMKHARGEIIAVMAADLQEPPELVFKFVRLLRTGEFDIAVGRRTGRHDPAASRLSSRAFWALYRRLVVRDMPPGGVDIFACTKAVSTKLLDLREANSSLVGLLYWVGFRRVEVPYERLTREIGKSAWTFRRKVRYLLDSVFSFTDLPLSLLIAAGVAGVLFTLIAGVTILTAYFLGSISEPGYTPLMLVILFSTFTIIVALGIVGTYVWRAFENTKARPLSIVMSHWSSHVER